MSNSPAFIQNTWAERARSSFEFRSYVEQLSTTATLIDTLFFGIRTTTQGAAGVYVELYYESAARTLSACMLTFVQAEHGFLREDTVKLGKIQINSPVRQTIDLTSSAAFGRAYWFTIRLDLRKDAENNISVTAASARLHHNYSAGGALDNPTILPSKLPDREHNLKVSGKLISGENRFCPNCSGIGAFDEMAIPKADWESGLSGYALYSCNHVSGREACTVCGGSGGKYEKWYLGEHPELSEGVFVAGSGLQGFDQR